MKMWGFVKKWRQCTFDALLYQFFYKEVKRMIDLYCALIINGKRDFASVPARYQAAVRDTLAGIGLDENGNIA